jgi:hypothetical protein
MNLAVVVDVPPIEASAAASVLSTCNAALGTQHCAIASPEAIGQWYAIVRFAPDQSTVFTIELRDGGASGTQVATSQLEFKDRDSERERWASAGVVVAALVAAQSAASSEPPPKPAAPEPVSTPVVVRLPPPSRSTVKEQRPLWLRLDLGAAGGSENEHGAFRVGPLARLGLAFSDLPVFALGSAAYTVRVSGTPDSTWLTGSLGFGVRIGFAQQRAALELRTEAVLESVRFHASDTTRSQRAQRTRWGPRLGLDVSGSLTKKLALVIGGEAAALHPSVDIALGGQDVDRLPPFAWGFISVVRYDFR